MLQSSSGFETIYMNKMNLIGVGGIYFGAQFFSPPKNNMRTKTEQWPQVAPNCMEVGGA